MKSKKLLIPLSEFVDYVREHARLGFAVAATVMLVYAKQAFSTDFYIDAEVILNHPHTIYNWNQIGRFGLIALKYLVGNNWYNPYFEAILFLVSLWGLGMGLSCLFYRFYARGGEYVSFIFAALFLIFPTYADQFMFRFQSFETVFAMLLVVLATRYFYLGMTEKNYWAYGLALFLDVFSFGIYQSMVNLQICFYIAVYLFTVEQSEKAERQKLIGCELAHFFVSFVVYGIIVKLFFDSGDYLSRQVGWFSGDLMSAVMNLLAYIKRILLAMDNFYPITYPACVCACMALLLWKVLCRRQKLLPYIIGFGGMLASPFFLALATGTPSPYRAQCMLPFTCAVLWLFFASWLQERGGVRYVVCVILGCIFLLCQTSVLMRMFYTQDVIRDADQIIATQIIERIQAGSTPNANKPVVFLGHLDAKSNASCYTKAEAPSYLSYSVYEFAFIEGVPVDTPDYFNTGRILGYFETLGFHYEVPSAAVVEEAKAAGVTMDSWPAMSSVLETQEYIVVKLSD
ncbi:MAG: glucosyltransferase domain-containing protein [Lachnospiraceae bacterium]|nr:glucosyltransferase domain-containing protein [Lachnospiraceae bacterium]